MKQLLVVVKNPFSARDYERMGLAELGKEFDVTVLDCTAWLLPVALGTRQPAPHSARIENVDSASRFFRLTRDFRGAVAIDYVGNFSVKALALFWMLRLRGIGRCVIDSGNVPYPGHTERGVTRWHSVLHWYLGGKRLQWSFLVKRIATKAIHTVFRPPVPDYAFIAGTACLANPLFSRARTIIPTHSFDAERFMVLDRTPPKFDFGYAVYLDEKLTHHEDDSEMGVDPPATDSRFLPALCRFFDRFEAQTGIPVVVAAYPSASRDTKAMYKRRAIPGETAELIHGARIVFAHGSTATSFAILWRKPLLHLTNVEIEGSWYFPWIRAMSLNNGAPILNLDDSPPSGEQMAKWFEIDEDKYRNYEQAYLRAKNESGMSLWKTVVASLNGES